MGTLGEDIFKARLNLVMERKGLKSIALARFCRVGAAAVSSWRREGGSCPEIHRLEAIAKFCGEPIEWFFTPLGGKVGESPQDRVLRISAELAEIAPSLPKKKP